MGISEIKQRLNILKVLSHYNIKPDKNSRICCPFHDDKTPSMQVYEKTGTVYCFSGSCKTHGKSLDVIDFIMNKEGITKHEALKKAAGLVSVATPGPEFTSRNHDTSQAVDTDIMPRAELMGAFFRFCENTIKTSKPAKTYMQSRGLWQATPTVYGAEMGFNSGTFHVRDNGGKELVASCLHYGLIKERHGRDGHTAFARNSLAFPLRDENGQITSLYFRSIHSGSILAGCSGSDRRQTFLQP
jgi:DNA primase